MASYPVTVSAGSLRADGPDVVRFPHRWTDEGVAVQAAFTGAHLLHLSAAGCVLNDLYRESGALGVELRGVRVTADGDFDGSWTSTGIGYRVELDTDASADDQAALIATVDAIAEIPRAIRSGAPVVRE